MMTCEIIYTMMADDAQKQSGSNFVHKIGVSSTKESSVDLVTKGLQILQVMKHRNLLPTKV